MSKHGGRSRATWAPYNFFDFVLCIYFYGLLNTIFHLTMHRLYVERCLKASSDVIPGAFSGRSNGSDLHHNGHSLQRIFSSSCGLIKYSGTALLPLYLSGDLELNQGPVERSRANLRHSLRPRCSTCNFVLKKMLRAPFHIKCIGPQFEKFRSCLNCSTVSSTADLDGPGVF